MHPVTAYFMGFVSGILATFVFSIWAVEVLGLH